MPHTAIRLEGQIIDKKERVKFRTNRDLFFLYRPKSLISYFIKLSNDNKYIQITKEAYATSHIGDLVTLTYNKRINVATEYILHVDRDVKDISSTEVYKKSLSTNSRRILLFLLVFGGIFLCLLLCLHVYYYL